MPDGPRTSSPVASTAWSVEEFAAELKQAPQGRFALLDACDEPRVPALARTLGERAVSLYRGRAEEDYWAIVPYLVQLDAALLSWIVENLGETPFGVFVAADVSLEDLRKHFRRFLMVRGPDSRQLYFRFYDPRVLPTFLTTCTADEANQFFGPIQWFGVLGPDALITRLQRGTVSRGRASTSNR